MKYYNYFFFVLWSMLAISCGATGEDDDGDALPEIVTQIQAQGRLYSTEYQLHKIITQDDTKQLQGSVFNHKYNIDLPLVKCSIAIPIEATVKAPCRVEMSKHSMRSGGASRASALSSCRSAWLVRSSA